MNSALIHHEKQQNATSPNLRHASESWWVLPSKITFFFITKRWYMWLRVNLIRNHITKQHLRVECCPNGFNHCTYLVDLQVNKSRLANLITQSVWKILTSRFIFREQEKKNSVIVISQVMCCVKVLFFIPANIILNNFFLKEQNRLFFIKIKKIVISH
jgi:hypothetical protein